jgi:hypothetical protein
MYLILYQQDPLVAVNYDTSTLYKVVGMIKNRKLTKNHHEKQPSQKSWKAAAKTYYLQ